MPWPGPAEVPGGTSRRAILRTGLLLGGSAVLGAGAGEVVHAATTGAGLGAVTPGEALMTEHGVLKRVLLAYDAAAGGPLGSAAVAAVHTCAEVVRDYVEGFHEGLEEAFVFPPLLRAGQQEQVVQTLLVQHGRGRRLTTSILRATAPEAARPEPARLGAALAAFSRMYARHEAWEDTVVYPAFRALTGDAALARLGDRFADLEQREWGDRALADVLERLRGAEAVLGTGDLAAVTPDPDLLA